MEKSTKGGQKPPKKRPLYTPEPVRVRVIERHMEGQSNRQIATEEKLDRATVGRILAEEETVHMIAQYRTQLFGKLPKALAVYDSALESKDERVRVAVATKLLEGSQVLNRGGIEHTMEIVKRGAPEADRRMRRLLILGELTELAIKKQRPLGPQELDQLEQAANSQCEED